MDRKRNKSVTSSTSESSLRVPTAKTSYVTDDDGWLPDTIHYLSPITTARTLCEGDFDYSPFVHPLGGSGTFLPITSASTVSCEETKRQRTVAIVKPEAMVYKDVVLKAIADGGLSVISERTVHLTPEQVAEIYIQHYGCPSFPNMVVSVSMGPILVLSLAGVNAVEKWKSMVGPYKTLQAEWFLPLNVRKRFGIRVDMPEALHASESVREANRESRFLFPENILEPIISDQCKVEDYCNLYLKSTLLSGLTELVHKKPVDPIIFLAEWLLQNNPFQPIVPYQYAMART